MTSKLGKVYERVEALIKLDLTASEVKKVFDDKFRIGTTWANKDIASKLIAIAPLFVNYPDPKESWLQPN